MTASPQFTQYCHCCVVEHKPSILGIHPLIPSKHASTTIHSIQVVILQVHCKSFSPILSGIASWCPTIQTAPETQYFMAKKRAPMGNSEGTSTPMETAVVSIPKVKAYQYPQAKFHGSGVLVSHRIKSCGKFLRRSQNSQGDHSENRADQKQQAVGVGQERAVQQIADLDLALAFPCFPCFAQLFCGVTLPILRSQLFALQVT